MPRALANGPALAGLCVLGALVASAAAPLGAQDGYRQPPEPIRQILDAEPTPSVSVSPDRSWLLLLERPALPPIAEVAAPELRLAGDRIDPLTNGPSRGSSFTGLRLQPVAGGTARAITTPAGARLGSPLWSADGRRIAFTVTSDSAVTLWLADVASGAAHQVNPTRLNATMGTPCRWLDEARLACLTIPAGRGPAPEPATIPAGPVIQESGERAAPNRTYQDLLGSPSDEALFEHYFTSQVVLVNVDGTVTPVGAAGVHRGVDPSPSGEYLLVQTLRRPFSYVVPASRFPTRIAVWELDGTMVKELAELPLRENVPIAFDAVAEGPRNVSWRDDAPATAVWVEALDGGIPSSEVAKHDRVYMLAAPFTAAPVTLIDLEYRAGGVQWARPDLALVREMWRTTQQTRTWAVNPSQPTQAPRKLFELSAEDRYGDPGDFVMTANAHGAMVPLLTADGRSAYLTGGGASPEGDRPFLDRIDLATGATTRLWRSEAPYYESVVTLLDAAATRAITRRESVTEVPNYHVRTIGGDQLRQLTQFTDPAPQFAGIKPELVRYKRADGVDLSATLYLPPGYSKEQGPLPFVFWAYPREFRSAAAASQVQGSPYRFVRPSGSSHLFLLTQGYGILDGPTMPIIGEGDALPNDTYVEQLVASAAAAVDKIVELGVADRARIAVGGHSYGAFMTANLLAHSDLFAAGIARSGAYNRTLTPFGFQAEARPYWEAMEIYSRMSPFTYANMINEPILLIHGMADNNSGTFPVQSERMFAAIKGLGGTVRYVQLPAESHGYRARESVGHTMWETVNWLDKYVKTANRPTAQ